MSTYQAINMVFNAFKDGLKTVIDMNTEMANLNKVVDMSKSQLASMSDSAVQMGKDLGQSSVEVAKAQAEFGRMYKDSSTINELSKTAIMGANVMDDTSTAEVAKGLTTIISSMKLEAKDSMTILDSMNEIKCVSPYIVMCK
jgi:TP901 family phage tail tape measure protein